MSDRKWIDSLALDVLDEVRDGDDFAELEGKGHKWLDNGGGLLTLQASNYLEAIEKAVSNEEEFENKCDSCEDGDFETCGDCEDKFYAGLYRDIRNSQNSIRASEDNLDGAKVILHMPEEEVMKAWREKVAEQEEEIESLHQALADRDRQWDEVKAFAMRERNGHRDVNGLREQAIADTFDHVVAEMNRQEKK